MYHPFRRTSHFESRTAESVPKQTEYLPRPTGNSLGSVDAENRMPNVADELAALRAQGSVRQGRQSLSAKSGGAALSTPEAEEAALKAKRTSVKLGDKRAKEILNKGSSAAAQADAEQAAKYTAKKREDWEKKARATEMLNRGGSGVSQEMEHSLSQTGKKKADWEIKTATKREMAGSGSPPKAPQRAAVPPQPQAPEAVVPPSGEPAAVDAPAPVVPSAPAPVAPSAPAPVAPSARVAKEEPTPVPVEAADDDEVPDLEEADEIPELETPPATQPEEPPSVDADEGGERQVTNRNEKKARKMMTRLGMRPVPSIARVTLKAGGGRGYFFLDRPDVFVSVGGKAETYVIFGEARQGGQGGFGGGDAAQAARAQAAAAQQRAAMEAAGAGGDAGMSRVVEEEDEDVPDLAAEVGAEAADEEGAEAKDVELVMGQASCSRAKAVAALRENDGDLVNAIMSLTT